jgi:hypothetical protein
VAHVDWAKKSTRRLRAIERKNLVFIVPGIIPRCGRVRKQNDDLTVAGGRGMAKSAKEPQSRGLKSSCALFLAK